MAKVRKEFTKADAFGTVEVCATQTHLIWALLHCGLCKNQGQQVVMLALAGYANPMPDGTLVAGMGVDENGRINYRGGLSDETLSVATCMKDEEHRQLRRIRKELIRLNLIRADERGEAGKASIYTSNAQPIYQAALAAIAVKKAAKAVKEQARVDAFTTFIVPLGGSDGDIQTTTEADVEAALGKLTPATPATPTASVVPNTPPVTPLMSQTKPEDDDIEDDEVSAAIGDLADSLAQRIYTR